MIKASELRIGNYISDTFGLDNTVNLEALKYITDYDGIHQAKPIILTEFWLEKLGFVSDSAHYLSPSLGIDKYQMKISKLYQGGFKWQVDMFTYVKLIHVHQLQNLFYSITGEDLKY